MENNNLQSEENQQNDLQRNQQNNTPPINVTFSGRGGNSMIGHILEVKKLIIMAIIVVAVAVIVVSIFNRDRGSMLNFSRMAERQVIVTETIITGFTEAQNLITMEAQLQHSIDIAERAGLFRLGTREQSFTFVGDGLFTTDLSGFHSDHLIIDSFRERIWVALERPVFYGVIVDFENTIIDDVATSFFGWGTITLAPEEFNELLRQAQLEMELLALQELYEESYAYTERAVTELINVVLAAAGIGGYSVYVTWR
ncbi:MAG: hypothetical protein FWC78_04370 [Defluviitaleaceae bacterium]|nr:hypothetical protein [Defluviitaleaceae bacterium]